MSIWITIILCGLITFAIRFLPLSNIMPRKLPAWIELAMQFVPVAILSAIIMPAVFLSSDTREIEIMDNPRITAAIIALLIAYFSRSVSITLIGGLSVMWFLGWLYP